MNLDALRDINCVERLEESANGVGSDPEVVKGIALFAADNGYDALSPKQKYHFDRAIRPLIENVQCAGYRQRFRASQKANNINRKQNHRKIFFQLMGG